MNASFLFIAAATLSSWLGLKSVETEIIINAAPETVWSVLTDFEKHKEWNEVLIPIKGELKEGSEITYEFHQDENNISKIPATVMEIVPNRLLNQRGGISTILTFDHKYILETVEEGTKLTIYEEYTGVGVHFWDETPVLKAYERLAKLIQKRVHALTGHE